MSKSMVGELNPSFNQEAGLLSGKSNRCHQASKEDFTVDPEETVQTHRISTEDGSLTEREIAAANMSASLLNPGKYAFDSNPFHMTRAQS